MAANKIRLEANPIIIKELRSRMRGGRAFATITVVLLSLAGASYVLYRIVIAQMQYSNMPVSPQVGQTLFAGLAFLELVMISAITPAVTAGAISGEKERLTYEMLVATPLRPASILWGKLISALSYVIILVFAAVPMFSLVFTFGGVTLREMGKALVILMAVAVMFGVLGLFFSALLGRTGRATVVSYLTLAAITFLPFFIYLAMGIMNSTTPPRWFLVFSPISTLFSALMPSVNLQGPMNFFWMFGGFLSEAFMGGRPVSMTGIPRPIYHYSLPLYAGIALILYLVSMRLVQPARRWRMTGKEILFSVTAVAVYAAAVALFFGLTSDRYENFLSGLVAREPTPAPVMEPFIGEAMAGGMGVAVAEPAVVEVGGATPTPLPYPPPAVVVVNPAEPSVEPDTQAAIYVAAILAMYADYVSPERNFTRLDIQTTTDDSVGDPNEPVAATSGIGPDTANRLLKNLAGFEVPHSLVLEPPPVDTDETGRYLGGAGWVTLGNIHQQTDGSVHVAIRLMWGPEQGAGKSLVLVQDGNNVWTVTGNTGVYWEK